MPKEERRYLLIIPIVLLFVLIVSTLFSFRRSGYFSFRWFNWISIFSKKTTTTTTRLTTTTTLPKSLASDKNYVQNQINDFLKDNPRSDESYARDVVYNDLAVQEKNKELCKEINTEVIKQSCYNYFKVAR